LILKFETKGIQPGSELDKCTFIPKTNFSNAAARVKSGNLRSPSSRQADQKAQFQLTSTLTGKLSGYLSATTLRNNNMASCRDEKAEKLMLHQNLLLHQQGRQPYSQYPSQMPPGSMRMANEEFYHQDFGPGTHINGNGISFQNLHEGGHPVQQDLARVPIINMAQLAQSSNALPSEML
tara:strand:- start:134 stop:670 length:537 start_codon:yes stop_codon:yes gene_type:complete